MGRATGPGHSARRRRQRFQSTPSVGRATFVTSVKVKLLIFQSTPSVGRATLPFMTLLSVCLHFNPRPPWGGRPQIHSCVINSWLFQSTPSVGRATMASPTVPATIAFQSTPSVGRATFVEIFCFFFCSISIHALRGEGDTITRAVQATTNISIHALRGEGDEVRSKKFKTVVYFNPRPPWGGRLSREKGGEIKCLFQSTPSVGRATISESFGVKSTFYFNPRPPWGGRQDNHGDRHTHRYFNPRPPWGGRPIAAVVLLIVYWDISIHALRGEGDEKKIPQAQIFRISIHALRGEGDNNSN